MKKIIFLSSTRADFGKIKSLIEIVIKKQSFEIHIFVTGMHMNSRYGSTVDEIKKCGYKNIFQFYNHLESDSMDIVLSRTIEGFSNYVKDIKPDLIIIHGDRVEALAGAIVGSLNNILTCHIEGGEVSGTVDELIRHAVSKLSHLHFVSNKDAKKRLIQMGEDDRSIFRIGSPDVDIMLSSTLPTLSFVKKYYEINFDEYAIAIFHPVVTELDKINKQIKYFVNALIESKEKYILIYPNNDEGAELIFSEYNRIKNNDRFRYLPSVRFEYFVVLLKNAKFVIGNSSVGVRESSYYGIPSVNIGTRQHKRTNNSDIINCGYLKTDILISINKALNRKSNKVKKLFGHGNSDKKFLKILDNGGFWRTPKQKLFQDIV
jgi:UDP-N-acetylglucosamine 2-epimerase (hydrolysing)